MGYSRSHAFCRLNASLGGRVSPFSRISSNCRFNSTGLGARPPSRRSGSFRSRRESPAGSNVFHGGSGGLGAFDLAARRAAASAPAARGAEPRVRFGFGAGDFGFGAGDLGFGGGGGGATGSAAFGSGGGGALRFGAGDLGLGGSAADR